jgi:sulfotransferase family protein
MHNSIRRFLKYKSRLMTAPFRIQPDFIVVGAEKSGTSSIYWNLLNHNQVIAPMIKELEFFSADKIRSNLFYRQYFPTVFEKLIRQMTIKSKVVTFETSPSYLPNLDCPQRIKSYRNDIKIIIILREPISRAHAKFHHAKRTAGENLSFSEVVNSEMVEIEKAQRDGLDYPEHPEKRYIADGIYYPQVKRYLDMFGGGNVLILDAAKYNKSFGEVYSLILKFVGIDSCSQKFHPIKESVYPEIDDTILQILCKFYQPYNEKLFDLLGVTFDWEY